MKRKKINALIIISVISLVALSAIQAYLIYNTYELKKQVFVKNLKDSVNKLDNIPQIEALGEKWYDALVQSLFDYQKKKILKNEMLQQFLPYSDSLNMVFKDFYKAELEKASIPYAVQYKKVIESIVIYENNYPKDTVFIEQNGHDHQFTFGDNFNDEQGIKMTRGRWFTEYDHENDNEENPIRTKLDLEVKTIDYVNIDGWENIVLGQMTSIFVLSIALFLFVVGLFFYSIKILIKQKKMADVKTDFINNITHELKTPLATLSIASRSLRNKEIVSNSEAFDNTVTIIERQNKRLHKLVDQVMNNTLGSEELELKIEKVDDSEYLITLINDFKLLHQDKNIKINYSIEVRPVQLHIDRFLMTTAINNILDNAVKYNNDSIHISLETKLENDNYYITISDNGKGIKERDQKRIFEKFYRVNTGDVHDVKGLGLGLFYASQIVKAHQGKITINSREGLGTSFIIALPV